MFTEDHSTSGMDRSMFTMDRSTSGMDRSMFTMDRSTSGMDRSMFTEDHSTSGMDRSMFTEDHSTSGMDRSMFTMDHSTSGMDRSMAGMDTGMSCHRSGPLPLSHRGRANRLAPVARFIGQSVECPAGGRNDDQGQWAGLTDVYEVTRRPHLMRSQSPINGQV